MMPLLSAAGEAAATAAKNPYTTDLPMAIAVIVLLVGITLLLGRGFKGPTAYDRILVMNSAGTKAVLVVALLGFVYQRPEIILDIALVYAVLNFVATVAILKFVRHKRLG